MTQGINPLARLSLKHPHRSDCPPLPLLLLQVNIKPSDKMWVELSGSHSELVLCGFLENLSRREHKDFCPSGIIQSREQNWVLRTLKKSETKLGNLKRPPIAPEAHQLKTGQALPFAFCQQSVRVLFAVSAVSPS